MATININDLKTIEGLNNCAIRSKKMVESNILQLGDCAGKPACMRF
jgi:hypothetical protein